MKNFLSHGFEYLLIAFVLGSSVIGLGFIKDPELRLGLVAALTLFYVVAGVWHHHEERNLHLKQVLEHLGIGAILFVILAALYR